MDVRRVRIPVLGVIAFIITCVCLEYFFYHQNEDVLDMEYINTLVEMKILERLQYPFDKNTRPLNQSVKNSFRFLSSQLAGPPEYICRNVKFRGSSYKYDCNTVPFKVNSECLVYSFGIGYDWEFDDTMARRNCEVHAFDPSMIDVLDHKRASGVFFHRLGLGSQTTSSFHPRIDDYVKRAPKQTWNITTLQNILHDLGHTERHLDILKIDIEGYEWDVLEDIHRDHLMSKIRQLLIEFHIFPSSSKKKIPFYDSVFRSLKNNGFRRFSGGIQSHLFNESSMHLQAECGFVNLKFDFQQYPLR